MDSQEALTRAVAALRDATLDDTRWPRASALIDEACGATGNAIVVSEGSGEDARIHFRAARYRGERNEELEADYFCHYHHRDERVLRLWQLPDSRPVPVAGLYTEREKRTSAAYNEALRQGGWQNGLDVHMDSPDGARITWTLADPGQPGDWGSRQTDLIERLIPHVRQFVQVRRTLASAPALNSSLGGLLDNDRQRRGFTRIRTRGDSLHNGPYRHTGDGAVVDTPRRQNMIGPHWAGSIELARYFVGHYVALGFVAGLVVGAVAASLAWLIIL